MALPFLWVHNLIDSDKLKNILAVHLSSLKWNGQPELPIYG